MHVFFTRNNNSIIFAYLCEYVHNSGSKFKLIKHNTKLVWNNLPFTVTFSLTQEIAATFLSPSARIANTLQNKPWNSLFYCNNLLCSLEIFFLICIALSRERPGRVKREDMVAFISTHVSSKLQNLNLNHNSEFLTKVKIVILFICFGFFDSTELFHQKWNSSFR